MPFSPLPRNVAEQLKDLATAGGVALDLGCGDGRLGTLLRGLGLRCFGLDKDHPRFGTTADLVGDALQPPLAEASLDLLVAGNLVRHLLVVDPRADFLTVWRRLVPATGRLLILEDEPTTDTAPARNYAALQRLLGRLVGAGRGPLVSLERFRCLVGAEQAGDWSWGIQENRFPADIERVLAMLVGQGDVVPGSEVARLRDDILRDGMNYGNFWWAMCPGTGR